MTRAATRRAAPAATGEKVPFDIDAAFALLRKAVAPYPKAAMFDLRDRGYSSPFEQLVGSLISARTRDETTLEVCLRLFREARTPEAMASLSESEIAALIRPATFAEPKARDIRALSKQIVEHHGGEVPQTLGELTSFRGVGPKIAALTLAVGFGQAAIAVDVHVHRITNRWGYVRASTPEKTAAELAEKLPRKYWVEINERLVPFGKWICTPARPHCSTCPLLAMCQQVGVTHPR